MFLTKKLLTALILPPTGLILLALLGLGLLGLGLSRRQNHHLPKVGLFLSVGALLALLALSIPALNGFLPVAQINTPISAEALAKTQAIVILGGGIYADAPEYGGDTLAGAGLERVRYGAKLARESRLPVLTTGGAPFGGTPEGQVMRSVLEGEYGVPVRWVEAKSRDTAENARLSAAILKREGIARIALVSHATHLPRAIPLFEHEGLNVTAAATLLPPPGPRAFEFTSAFPNAATLARNSALLHESLGRLFNQLTGK